MQVTSIADLMSPITGDELIEARTRAGYTQKDLADELENSERAVQLWERNGVPRGKEPLVRAVLGFFILTPPDVPLPPLRVYPDLDVWLDIGRRLGFDHPVTNPGDGADTNLPTITPGRIVGRGARRPRQR